MGSLPKISIVTPSYNQGDYIEETICSVLDQQYPDLEYIVIDGGSTDQTLEVIKRYEKYLSFWVSEPDKGQSDAINKGLLHCTGKVFNWLNSDDLLEKHALAIVGEAFADDQLDILSGTEIHFSASQEALKHGSIIYPSIEKNLIDGVIYQPSTFWRMDAMKRLLPIHETLDYLMDTDLWVRYIMAYGTKGIKKIKAPLARFRVHPEAKTTLYQDGFDRERWLLRNTIFDKLELFPKEWLDLSNAAVGDLNGYSRLIIQKEINEHIYKRLFAEKIAYSLYISNEYSRLRKFLFSAIVQGIFSRKLMKYLLRMSIPLPLLKRLRD